MVKGIEVLKSKMGDKDTFIVFISPKIHESKGIGVDFLKFAVSELKSPVVYLSLDRPVSSIRKILEADQIDTKLVDFIDAVTIMSGFDAVNGSCRYIRSPENLTDISISLSEAISSLSASKPYVILDSLSTLLMYNKPTTVEKFIHMLNLKIKQNNAKNISIYSKMDPHDDFPVDVLGLFDDSIDLTGGC